MIKFIKNNYFTTPSQRSFSYKISTLKDDIFTISIIGLPNTGKSTLFNRMLGKPQALVSPMPGLTRDRRQAITSLFGLPIRLVDTAGWENANSIQKSFNFSQQKSQLSQRQQSLKSRQMLLSNLIKQTRNALLYSDLALWLLDARTLCSTQNFDQQVELASWLSGRMPLKEEELMMKEQLINFEKKIQNKNNYYINIEGQEESYENKGGFSLPTESDKIIFDQQQYDTDLDTFRLLKEKYRNSQSGDDVKVPKLFLVANKCEENFDSSDLYNEMPKIWKHIDSDLFFISGEHGDGLPELYQKIQQQIPRDLFSKHEEKVKKRVIKYNEFKEKFRKELIELKKQENIEQGQQQVIDKIDFKEINQIAASWEVEFQKLNPLPQQNSDFDSDNQVNPLETLTQPSPIRNSSMTKGESITSQNFRKRKPINISVVGRPNVGKSTLVNTLLKSNRVVVSDLPGTTRDSVTTQWIHKGRRINLVDTAGLRPNSSQRNKSKLSSMVYQDVQRAISISNVVIILIDSIHSFTPHDFMIIKQVIENGRAAIIAANKWDLVDIKYRAKAAKWIQKQLIKNFGDAKNMSLFYISARTGLRSQKIVDQVMRVYQKWNTRVSTSLLNKWLTAFKKIQAMPNQNGLHLNIRFISQVSVRPPTFFICVNKRKLVDPRFERHIRSCLIKQFSFQGVPVRILLRDLKYMFNRGDKNLSIQSYRVMKRIQAHNNVKDSPTKKKRQAGSRFLYKAKRVNP